MLALTGCASITIEARPQVVAFAEHEGSEEEEDQQNELLVGNLACNRFPHSLSNNFFFSSHSLGVDLLLKVICWWLSCEGKSSKDVHNNVDPQQLDNCERSLTNN